MSKKVAGLQDDVLVTGGIILVGYSLVRNLIPGLMGNISPEDRQTLDDQQSDQSPDNVFSVTSSAYDQWFSPIETSLFSEFNVTDFESLYINAYRQFLSGDLPTSSPLYPICQIYHELHSAVTGHLVSGDQDAANQALNMITNKWQVGAIANLWAYYQGSAFGSAADMFRTIRNGTWPMQYGLNAADFASQVKRLNNLPD